MFDKDMKTLVGLLGGKDNIIKVGHCISRLRFVLKDDSLAEGGEIEKLDSVAGFFVSGGTTQVIIGTEVKKAFKELIAVIGEDKAGTLGDIKVDGANKQGFFARFMLIFPGVFMPVIPAIAASGLLLGLKNLLNTPGVFNPTQSFVDLYPQLADIVSYIGVFAETAFAYLPVLIGWSGAVYFGASPIIGIVLGLLLVSTSLVNGWDAVPGSYEFWNIFGVMIPKVGYQGSVLPMLVSVFLLSKVEQFFDRWVPKSMAFVFVPMLALFVTGTLAFTVVGPITRVIGDGLGHFMLMIQAKAPLLGGFLIGLTMQPIVITGMHHTYTAINLQLYGQGVGSYLFPIEALSDWSHTIATFMTMFYLRNNKKMKNLAFSAAVTNAFGISEPAMFGVTLRYKWPFLAAILSTGIWGAFVSVSGVKSPGGGLSSMLSFLSVYPQDVPTYLIAQIGVVVTTAVLVVVFSKFTKYE
ncbi:MAG: PTS transporter subunit EIIC [Brevinema sp.]